jgi:ABC-type branched-subunit amino acid transport system ATPase component
LKGVSFQVRRGETKIIIGRQWLRKINTAQAGNGTGKADEGQILIESEDITKMRERDLAHVG